MKSVVVNFYAGPGAGKTFCAWELAAQLKAMGVNVEYVPEFAKELVYDKNWKALDGSLESQRAIFEEQNRRIARVYGQAEVIATDSPITLSVLYLKEPNPEFVNEVLQKYGEYNNFNLMIKRDTQGFTQAGRIHDLEQSIEIDGKIKQFLQDNKIFHGQYWRDNIAAIAADVIYSRENNKHFKDAPQGIGASYADAPWFDAEQKQAISFAESYIEDERIIKIIADSEFSPEEMQGLFDCAVADSGQSYKEKLTERSDVLIDRDIPGSIKNEDNALKRVERLADIYKGGHVAAARANTPRRDVAR